MLPGKIVRVQGGRRVGLAPFAALRRVVPHQQLPAVGAERERLDIVDQRDFAGRQAEQRQLVVNRFLLLAQVLLLRLRDADGGGHPFGVGGEHRTRAKRKDLGAAVGHLDRAQLVGATGASDGVGKPLSVGRQPAVVAGERQPFPLPEIGRRRRGQCHLRE